MGRKHSTLKYGSKPPALKFGKNRFKWVGWSYKKSGAKKIAKDLRKDGYNVRIITRHTTRIVKGKKRPFYYDIYARKKS